MMSFAFCFPHFVSCLMLVSFTEWTFNHDHGRGRLRNRCYHSGNQFDVLACVNKFVDGITQYWAPHHFLNCCKIDADFKLRPTTVPQSSGVLNWAPCLCRSAMLVTRDYQAWVHALYHHLEVLRQNCQMAFDK